MNKVLRNRLAPIVLVGVLALAGCAGKVPAVPGSFAEAAQKPKLSIPKQFASEQAKRDFAVKAVEDGHYAEANQLLTESVAKDPNSLAYQRLGTARYNLADYQGAIDAWTKAADMDTSVTSEMRNNIGNALRDLRKTTEAEAAYRKALELDPERTTAAINLASMLKDQGRLKEALDLLEKARAVNKMDPTLPSLVENYRKLAESNAKS